MRNFFADSNHIKGNWIELDAGETHHGRDVLRIASGEIVRVFNGQGTVCEGAFDPRAGRVRAERITQIPPPQCEVTVALALLKLDRWDWFLEKAVEIGVSSIVPLMTQHTVVKVAAQDFQRKAGRWRQIAISALKQSGQPFLPSIELPTSVEAFCQVDTPGRDVSAGVRWILSERGGRALKTVLVPDLKRVTVLVGPEGGWSDPELEIARKRGFQPVSLGSQILRAETVPLYALSAIRFVTQRE